MPRNATATARRQPGELFSPRFQLFADVLSLALLTSLCSLPLVTAPAALAAACQTLRRGALYDEPADARRYLTHLRSGRPGTHAAAGLAALGAGGVLALDALLTRAGLPGAPVFGVLLAVIAALAATLALRACADPSAAAGHWRTAVRTALAATTPANTAFTLAALAAAAVISWMLPPLAFLAPGPLALALTAVTLRTG
jgi:hypothetical protein